METNWQDALRQLESLQLTDESDTRKRKCGSMLTYIFTQVLKSHVFVPLDFPYHI